MSIDVLKGQIIRRIQRNGDEEIIFETDKKSYRMYHRKDCCETVLIEDICGDLESLIDSPILIAEERTNKNPEGKYGDTSTWTFYELSTIKGSVTIRWFGESNGYYSETVDFEIIDRKKNEMDAITGGA